MFCHRVGKLFGLPPPWSEELTAFGHHANPSFYMVELATPQKEADLQGYLLFQPLQSSQGLYRNIYNSLGLLRHFREREFMPGYM